MALCSGSDPLGDVRGDFRHHRLETGVRTSWIRERDGVVWIEGEITGGGPTTDTGAASFPSRTASLRCTTSPPEQLTEQASMPSSWRPKCRYQSIGMTARPALSAGIPLDDRLWRGRRPPLCLNGRTDPVAGWLVPRPTVNYCLHPN